MTNDITTATAQDVELNDLAAEIRRLDKKLEQDMIIICEKTAIGCQRSGEKSIDAFLAKALPNRAKSTRKAILYAGQQVLARRLAIFELDYGWSALVEINALPPEHLDWAYEEKRTVKQVKDKLKELKNPDDSHSSTTHPLPEKSDESIFIECNSYSPSTTSVVDEPSLQQSSRGVSFSEEVCSTQPQMDKDCPKPSDELVSMGTEASRVADADYEELKRLVRCIEAIHSRNLTTDGSGISQDQWRDLSQQYKSIKYCADLRWQRLRAEMDREHEAFIEQLDNGLRAIGSKGISQIS